MIFSFFSILVTDSCKNSPCLLLTSITPLFLSRFSNLSPHNQTSQLEIQCQGLIRENETLKALNSTLKSENESLKKERTQNSVLKVHSSIKRE